VVDILPALKREDSPKETFSFAFPRFSNTLSRGTSAVATEV